MQSIYLDNAATSFPKAPKVAEDMSNYIINIGCNINRGAYSSSYQAEKVVFNTRELLCELFNYNKPENVVFTKNITESLNVLIKGLLKKGDHIIVSSMEHNAVMRPINSMVKLGVDYDVVSCDEKGFLNSANIKKYIRHNTKAVIMTNASNVCGTILPLKEVGQICRENNLYFIVDTAQTAGFMDINIEELNAHALAFTGHKSLLGPQGIGGFIIKDDIVSKVEPLIEGGTGSLSEHEVQPSFMPDKYEAGTPNVPGVFGLNSALKYIKSEGISSIREKELYLTEKFINKVKNLKNVRLVGTDDIKNRTAVVSLDFMDFDNAEISHYLSKEFNIMTRCGLHCAPSAHKTLKTFPKGTVRFSFSHFNLENQIDYAVDSLYKVMNML